MASNMDDETNQLEGNYYDQDEDDLGDFIVYSDEDEVPVKHKHQRQEELEDDIVEEEVEEEVEPEEEEIEEVEVEVEEEEEEEEEEVPVGQQEILSLREQLKEKIRKKNAAMAAGTFKASCSSSVSQRMMPLVVKDGYGTFFGPSKPVLARRVMEEGCSSFMKEQQNQPSRKRGKLISKAQPGAIENLQKPKLVSEERRKVDALRENRDYSSLFSDDADTPEPTKESPLVPKTEYPVRALVDAAGMGRAPSAQPAQLLPSKDRGKIAPAASTQTRVHSNTGSLADRKRMIAAGRNRSNLPNMKASGLPPSNSQKLQPLVQNKRQQTLVPGQRQQQPVSQGQRMQRQSQNQRLQGNGRQQSSQGRRPDPSIQGQSIGQNGSAGLHGRLKSARQQLGPSSKIKDFRPMEKRAVKRKSDDETGNVSSLIRKIFNYHPEKFIGRDEDDSNMEADFASIEEEERRSAQLARKEDEEQFRLIQEEEKRERAMKRKKAAHKE